MKPKAASSSSSRISARRKHSSRPDPKKFFTTPHYDGYPTVLVNLEAVGVRELRELITESWRCKAPKRVLQRHDDVL